MLLSELHDPRARRARPQRVHQVDSGAAVAGLALFPHNVFKEVTRFFAYIGRGFEQPTEG